MKDEMRVDEELRMFQGNLNRMCLTYSQEELTDMYTTAAKRLEIIYSENLERIR